MKTRKITIPEQVIEVTFAEYVGNRIRQRRKELGLTQDELVRACDISKPFLSECENGKRGIGFSKLYEVARVLGCTTDWFAKGWE